jgi:hypothetical protein
MACTVMNIHRYLGKKIHCRRLWAFLEKMEAALFSKTLENFYQTTRCHILDYTNLNEISSHYFFPLFLVMVKGYLMICLSKHTGSLGAGKVWVVNTTPLLLYQWERNVTHCTCDWKAWTGTENVSPTGPGCPDRPGHADYAIPGASFFGTL